MCVCACLKLVWTFELRRDTKTETVGGWRENDVKDGREKERENEKKTQLERERGHVGFGLLVLPSGQPADLFM